MRNLIGREAGVDYVQFQAWNSSFFQSRSDDTVRTSLSLPCGLFRTHTFNSKVILTMVILACMRVTISILT